MISLLEWNNKEYDRYILELQTDVCTRFIENLLNKLNNDELNNIFNNTNENFNYYPDLSDTQFNQKIFYKKEFNDNKMPLLKDKKKKKSFVRSNNQRFARNYISPHTPYNGVLLWYEVGVGKTCAAISIAESFKENIRYYNKKILVLTPSETLKDTWKNEIFNLEKEIQKYKTNNSYNVQCTGNEYTSNIVNILEEPIEKLKKQINKLINTYYEFMGYRQLAGSIKRDLKNFLLSKKNIENAKIKYIRDRFSNTVIIMDEVHFTREGDINKDKIAREWLEMIVRYSENTKIILLTATPMYNVTSEIVWLINLLLLNDKKAPIEKYQMFDKQGIQILEDILEEGILPEQYLINKSRGYVSFVRAKNPFTFPIKLKPESDKNIVPNSKLMVDSGNYVPKQDSDTMKEFYCYSSNMSKWQFDNYNKILQDSLSQNSNTGYSVIPLQISNIIYPIKQADGVWEGTSGSVGFNSCFTEISKKVNIDNEIETNMTYFTMNTECKNFKDKKSIFHRNNIGEISCKFKSIIDNILNSEGIIFIFSDYLSHGVKAIALALEENGFQRMSYKKGKIYVDNSLTNSETDKFCTKNKKFKSKCNTNELKTFNQAKYIKLDGSIQKVELNQLVKESRGEGIGLIDNSNGHHIKVILGSSVTEQGLSFKCVREVHLLDPWFHLNQSVQSEGRAIRNESHLLLPKNKRNVTVFLHISSKPIDYSGPDYELIDERTYRKAYNKRIHMSKVQRLLKKNAIDCKLNIYNNILLQKYYHSDEFNQFKLIDSKNNERIIELYDKDYSDECDYLECEYKCIPEEESNSLLDSTTFNTFFSTDDVLLAKELIKTLFLNEYVYTQQQIIDEIIEIYPDITNKIIYRSLHQLISKKEHIYDANNKPGYIIEVNNYYIFQPIALTDRNAPIKYRYLENYPNIKKFKLDKINMETLSVPKKKKFKTITKTKINFRKIYTMCIEYVMGNSSIHPPKIGQYRDYLDVKSKKLPTCNDLIKYLFLSELETKYSEDDRLNLLLDTLYQINQNGVDVNDNVQKAIYEYYYTPKNNKFSYFIDENMLGISSKENKLVGLIFISEKIHNYYKLYIIKDDEIKEISGRQRSQSQYSSIKLSIEQLSNLSSIFGYTKLDKKKNIGKFYIINKPSDFIAVNLKKERRGGVCGTAQNATTRTELWKTVNNIKKEMDPSAVLYSDESYIPNKGGITPNLKSRNLCEEIELLLRHRDNNRIFTDVTNNNRYFYRIEEKMYIDKFKPKAK